MAHVLNDRVKETTTTTGTGTIDLGGAETGFETFVQAIGNSNTTYYAIAHQSANEFEIGIGTVTDASPDTLSRTTVISSTNSDSLVDFSAGTKDVFCTLPASKAVFFDPSSGSSDVSIGSRGTNPMGLSVVGTVLAITEQTNVASLQMDGNQASRIDMGSGPGTRQFVIYTDTANYSSLERKDAKPILFATDNTERLRITATGNVGIGASSPDALLHLQSAGAATAHINLESTHSGGIPIYNMKGAHSSQVRYQDENGNNQTRIDFHDAGKMEFIDAANSTTRMIIDSSGNIGIGSTPPTTIRNDIHATEKALQVGRAAMLFADSGLTTDLQNNSHLNNSDQRVAMSGTLGGSLYGQYNGVHTWYTAAAVAAPNVQSMTARMALDISGNLVVDNNITAYGTPSDIKLKENIEVIDNAVDKVKQLKGITYTLKSDGNRLTGLIAQDLEKVLPEAVYTSKTIANEKEGEVAEEHLAIRYGNTVGLLVEAIKEQQEQIDTLNDYVKLQSATIMDMERRLNELEDK